MQGKSDLSRGRERLQHLVDQLAVGEEDFLAWDLCALALWTDA